MLASFRVSYALQRWEVLLVAISTALLAAGMVWVAWQAHLVVAIDPGCFAVSAGEIRCRELVEQFDGFRGFGGQLLSFGFAAPFGIGFVLGVPLVAREVEGGTASLVWTLSRSRLVWLAKRITFVALVAIGLLVLVAVAGDLLAQAILPERDLTADFSWYGHRGGLIVMRGLLALGIGLAIGAIVGRQLPAVLVAVFASIAIFTGVSLAMDRWLEADAQRVRLAVESGPGISSRLLIGAFQTPNGELLSGSDLDTVASNGVWNEERGELFPTAEDRAANRNIIGWSVELYIAGRRYPEIVLRESALLGGLALLAGGLAFVVVQQRRPY